MQNPVAELLTNPFFLLLAAAAIFFFLVWAALPFALYGIRRRLDQNGERLDRISETLTSMLEVLMIVQEQGYSPESEITGAGGRTELEQRSGKLFAQFRQALVQFAPVMHERVLDSDNVVIYIRDSAGTEAPCLTLARRERDVLVTIPLQTLDRAFPAFSPDRFREYASSFLHERHGYFTVSSPDGAELRVTIEPRESYMLDLFIGIIREQIYELLGGDSE